MLSLRYVHKRSPETSALKGPLPSQLSVHIGFLLGRLGNTMREHFDEILAPHKIHCRHYAILATLSDGDSLTQQELSNLIRIDRSSMVTFINELETVGLVERNTNSADRRSHLICLTAKGREVFRKTSTAGRTMERKFLRHLSDKEGRALQRLLKKLLQRYLDSFNHDNFKDCSS